MRVVIAEDSFVVRAGLVEVVTDRGHEVAAAVGDAETLLDAVAEHRPDVAIVDVRMPPTHTDEGLRAAIRIKAEHPATAILVFSQYVEARYASELLGSSAGGVGYLLKDNVSDVAAFSDALDRVGAGGTALDPEVVRQLLGATRQRERLTTLTPRERDVMVLVAQGRSNRAISQGLSITYSAVEKHIASIFMKLGLGTSDDDNRRVLAVLWFLGG
ncbi:response regulator transcription factor [Pseudonocardia sp. TRM90224]|uniref:response regulator transcription factor n=1 Tax=Pseudonocardia sp. TRM90224 TaxID=2812678 RepID=UPI001E33DC8C|nr:response regulator transcription factor [Pseudonocardia sp. TRM90224]